MKDRYNEGEEERSILRDIEAPMETNLEIEVRRAQPTSKIGPATTCAHSRLIDDILTKGGKRTGKVRCLECGAVVDDPSHDPK